MTAMRRHLQQRQQMLFTLLFALFSVPGAAYVARRGVVASGYLQADSDQAQVAHEGNDISRGVDTDAKAIRHGDHHHVF
jgi:type IV secretory pathway TrbL component